MDSLGIILSKAAKGGRVGVTSFVIESQASATTTVSIELAANMQPMPVSITSVATGENYIDVAWGKSDDVDFGKYVVYVSTASGSYGRGAWNSSNQRVGSCRVGGLNPGTRYYLRVAVLYASGVPAYSEQRSVTT